MTRLRPATPGSTLGENIKAARLGFGWVPEWGAWLRLSPAGDYHQVHLAPAGADLPGPRRAADRLYRAWWEGTEVDQAVIISSIAQVVAGQTRLLRLRRSVIFVLDGNGAVVAPT